MPSPAQPGNTKFTVLVRLPFPRGGFVDPPPVDWNAAKDQALWDILSRPSKGNDIDWKALAESFDVTLQFLLQQAAWLYDRQLSQVRAQMRKVGNTHSNTASPVPGSIYGSTALGQPPKPGQGSTSKVPTRLASQPKETPPRAPTPRRTSSGNTVQQTKAREASHPGTPTLESEEPKWESHDRRPSTGRREAPPVTTTVPKSPTFEEEDLISSSSESNSEDDDSDSAGRKGLGFKRFGRFSTHRPGLRDEDDDDDESPAFLPIFREHGSSSHRTAGHDLSTTLRLEQDGASAPQRRVAEPRDLRKSMTTESSESSISSGVPVYHSHNQRRNQNSHASPRRLPELARMSPRRSTTSGRDISDGTPSMGSSFSDLDGDTSVTQSMLEEALLSNMQHGGMASRMSTFSQAIRSRYLP